MKVINATWEKRNFGMDTYEISLDKKDLRNFDEVLQKIEEQNFKKAYVIIKMPTGDLKALHQLEDDGFRFLETQLSLADKFTPSTDDLVCIYNDSEVNSYLELVPKEKDAWERIINKITPGMFDMDRVSLDPFLGEEISCKRYQNWCRDLFDNEDSEMFVRKMGDIEFGFGISIKDKLSGSLDGVLGGIFEEYKGMGLGATWLKDSVLPNRKKVVTNVSSNNVTVTKIHQRSGRIITKMRYVLRKIYK